MAPTPPTKKPRVLLGLRYSERRDDPPAGLTWISVAPKETLGSIADRYGITWMDLALINFRTVDGKELNWYLRHYTGCRTARGKWYVFTGTESPGKILVPADSRSTTGGAPRTIGAVRDGTATRDSKLEVELYELTRSQRLIDISGKWLYVFSGPGISFGYQPPSSGQITVRPVESPEFPGDVPWIPSDDPNAPGSAYTRWSPGNHFFSDSGPDRIDYEIYVTAKDPTSGPYVDAIAGAGSAAKLQTPVKFGSSWYYLSDQVILEKASTDPRHTRTQHAFRNQKFVTLDLAPGGAERRYYFFLSPVQLGPNALEILAAHPEALTPFRDPSLQTTMWDTGEPDYDVWQGPPSTLGGRVKVGVKDPFAWAEAVAEEVFADSVQQYAKWMQSTRDQVLEALKRDTGWTAEHFHLAGLLKGARDVHPDPASIDGELSDPAKWKKDLSRWQTDLIDRNAHFAAAANRDLLELRDASSSWGHRIIETAIMEDARGDLSVDGLDLARGLAHYATCLENMPAGPDGGRFLIEEYDRSGGQLNEMVWSNFADVGTSAYKVEFDDREMLACRHASGALLTLIALRWFVEPDQRPPAGMTMDAFARARIEGIAEIFNQFGFGPATLRYAAAQPKPSPTPSAPSPVPGISLPSPSRSDYAVGVGAFFVGALDISDKATSWVLDPDCVIDASKGSFHRSTAAFEEWFKATPGRQRWAVLLNKGTTYGVKGLAGAVTTFNLYNTVAKARFDYQHTVSAADWLSAASTFTVAMQDVLAELAAWSGSARLAQWMPSAFTTASKDAAGWGALSITSRVGQVFASVNVVAMVVAGGVTTYLSFKGFAQARSHGDTSAAVFYGVATAGAVAMTAGAMTLAYSLWFAGGAFSATGVGATVGVVLFAVGGAIAAIATLGALLSGDDEVEIFARKCFFGKDGALEPRFPTTLGSGGPPGWSHATNSSTDSWPLAAQRRAILNILGRFRLSTQASELPEDKSYRGTITWTVTPQLLLPGARLEIAVDQGGGKAAVSFALPGEVILQSTGASGLLRSPWARPKIQRGRLESLTVTADHAASYSGGKKLITTVTLTFLGQPNRIIAKKLVLEDGWFSDASTDEIQADLFE